MVVLSFATYSEIQTFIRRHQGLTIQCRTDLQQQFPHIAPDTLCSILSKETLQYIRIMHSRISSRAIELIQEYTTKAKATQAHDILLNMAVGLRIPPVCLCRIILTKKFKGRSRAAISELLRYPDFIQDSLLAVNVSYCLYNENMEGPMTDTIRLCIGEEYEQLLKQMARDAGMVFYDEGDLRRTGYDKTPDLKLAIPFLYRGQVINWIESKASFGDMDSHRGYIKDQLASYGNRFGCGIVIYWFGYLDLIADCAENGNFAIVIDRFPEAEQIEFLKFNLPSTVASLEDVPTEEESTAKDR